MLTNLLSGGDMRSFIIQILLSLPIVLLSLSLHEMAHGYVAARLGDPTALEVFKISGKFLGRGLSIIIDILNPEKIVIGSIFARSRDLLWDEAEKIIRKEALPFSTDCCEVVAAELGENIGDFAAIATSLLN